MRRPPVCTALVAAIALAGLLTGCPADETIDDRAPVPTAVAVDPFFFLRDVPCSDSPGALRSYVATLTDQTAGGFVLPSSPPISCSEQVSFRYVVVGHAYTAEVDGYIEAPDELVPVGGNSSGSRQMLLAATSAPVTPSWTTVCGQGPAEPLPGQPYQGPAIASANVNQVITFCEPLTPGGGVRATSIVVDPEVALGGLACEDVGSFDVRPEAALPAYLNVACDPASPGGVVYDVGIVAGVSYSFRVEADVAGVPHGARCEAVAAAELQVTASCAPLSSQGALDVALAPLFAGERGAPCSALVDVVGPGGAIESEPVGCADTVRFAELEPGAYTATVSRVSGDVVATCTADVLAGGISVATCL